jgi:hypothetical protein
MHVPTADAPSAALRGTAVPPVPTRPPAPRAALALAAAGVLLMAVVGAAAPNGHTIDARLPLLTLPPLPGAASTYVTCAAIAAQGLGLLGLLRAARRGWRPPVRLLLAAGAAAAALLCAVTPVGSADVASYAAYGRIAALGGDPYTATPAQLGGAYAHLVSASWLETPSVYGPVATWLQQAAATLGGARPLVTVWLLMLANAAAYLLTGVLLVRMAADRVRAALLWSANPLLLGLLVAGAHLDTLVALLGACAAYAASRSRGLRHELLVGALLGCACGVKISAALLAVGLSLPLLRRGALPHLAVRAASCLAVSVALYAPTGGRALAPLLGAAQLVSVPSGWQLVRWIGAAVLGASATGALIGASWPVLMLLAARVVHRRHVPAAAVRAASQLRGAHALAFGWILAAPWCMPWYTALVWPFAALLPRARTDLWLAWLTLALALVHNTGGHGWTW